MVQLQITKENGVGKSVPRRSKGKYTACFQGSHGEVKVGAGRQRGRAWSMPLLGSVGGVILSSLAKKGSVNSNQKRGVLVTSMGSCLRGA